MGVHVLGWKWIGLDVSLANAAPLSGQPGPDGTVTLVEH